uniref:Vacuolar protein sorting-associated protein 54 n=1 Tax=Strigamia maritima TaxID=126957 RepID=T1J950_STRMM
MLSSLNNPSWKKCSVCPQTVIFKTPIEFTRHLREYHCTREGGSFICTYGLNNVCSTLPGFGVSDEDYGNHLIKHHGQDQRLEMNVEVRTLSSNPPNVVCDQGKWTVYCSTQNLPAVLNDPSRGKQKDFFTKTWGDSFTEKTKVVKSPYIPEINRSHFENYLKKTTKRYKKHIRQTNVLVSDASNFSIKPSRQLAQKAQAELQNIPKIYLQPTFTLENQETFNTVFPLTQLHNSQVANKSGNKDRNSSKLLQEKLTHYLDIVEMHIAHQISQKSAAFFSAMTSHDILMEQLSETILGVKKLRYKVHQIENILVKGSLQIIGLKRVRQNYATVYNKLKLIATVHQTQPTIQILLSASDFVGALDLISTTQEVLAQELAGIHGFRHLGSQLAELEKVINTMIQAEFVRYATADLNRPLTEMKPVMEEERLVSIVFGMMHQRQYNFVELYKDEVFATIDAILKQTVIEHVSKVDDTEHESVGNFRDLIRPLGFPEWKDLLEESFQNVLKLLTRIKAIHGVMIDVVNIAGGKAHSSISPLAAKSDTPEATNINVVIDEEAGVSIPDDEHQRVFNNLKDLLTTVCDYAHERCTRFVIVKAKDGFLEKLNVNEFFELSKCVEKFVSDCESVCGKRSASLLLAFQNQSNRFVNRFHEDRKTKLSLILDNERWKQADVPSEFQELVDHIAETGELAMPKKASDTDLCEAKHPKEYLFINGEKYAVVGTVLLLLKMVIEYCYCISNVPSFTPDLLTRLVDLLKLFNSRTCQLVLGAGALQLIGLKSITTRNLALASRCLQLMLRYIPLVKAHFKAKLSLRSVHLVKHFDQLSKDYSDHVEEIVAKLISIVDSITELELTKWEVKPPVPSLAFRNICKQMAKFHEALLELLPEDQIRELIKKITFSFQIILGKQLQKRNVINDGGPQHALITSELAFYTRNLKDLKCVKLEIDFTTSIWNGT